MNAKYLLVREKLFFFQGVLVQRDPSSGRSITGNVRLFAAGISRVRACRTAFVLQRVTGGRTFPSMHVVMWTKNHIQCSSNFVNSRYNTRERHCWQEWREGGCVIACYDVMVGWFKPCDTTVLCVYVMVGSAWWFMHSAPYYRTAMRSRIVDQTESRIYHIISWLYLWNDGCTLFISNVSVRHVVLFLFAKC